MKKRLLSTILSLCMALTMVLSLLPAQVVAQELTYLSHTGGQNPALQSIATRSIGPNEAEVVGDLYDLLSARASLIKLIDDIDFGTLPIDYEVTIDLNGHVLRAPYGGSVIKVENGGNLTLIDSNPDAEHKFTPNADGLWVLDEANGTKIVKGGVITGGTGSSNQDIVSGGGVYVEGGGRFTMNGGNIVGCMAVIERAKAQGGGVYVAENGVFTMTGGSIAGCTAIAAQLSASAMGGGICNEGTTTLSGTAEIRDCRITHAGKLFGGGVYDNGVLHISGDVKITGCRAEGFESDAMYVNSGSTVDGGFFDGTVINCGRITGGVFEKEVANKLGTITGGLFYGGFTDEGIVSGPVVTYKVDGAVYATQIVPQGSAAAKPADPTSSTGGGFLGWYTEDGTAYDFTQPVMGYMTLTAQFAVIRGVDTKEALIAALADDTVDVIKLKSDIEIDATLNITRAVTLDLVGYMLEMKGSGSVIAIKDGGHLTLVDSDLTSTYYFTPDADGLWKWGTSGTKTVHGGVIYGGTGTEMYYSTYGGGVLIEPGGQFTMNGGSIVGCKADGSGGGVVVQCGDANGIFTMNSGAIIGCVADSGGGVETDGGEVGEYGQFTMNGGVIDSCVATGRTGGGGVRSDGLFIMGKDATIKNCKAVEYGQRNFGSGIVLAGDDRQTIDGTVISEDAVDEKYIFMNRGTMAIGENANIHANITLEGGKIDLDGSRATVYGKITNDSYGGVSCFADGLVTVTYKVNNADYAIQILRSGSLATRPIEPTKTGYEFDGWFTSDGTKWDYNTAVTEDITLTGSLYVPVTSESELAAALADDTVEVIKLKDNTNTVITLEITRAVTLDLNGCILSMISNIRVCSGGHLTLIDSNPTVEHRFVSDNGLWKLYETSGIETVLGGVIYGGKGLTDRNSNGYGGGVYIYDGGAFTMNGGNIVGCKAEGYIAFGGGVFVAKGGAFTMTGGSITGCTAVAQGYGMAFGGGIRNDGEFNDSNVGRTALSGTAVIRDCHAKGVTVANQLYGGGISDAGTLTISGDVKIIGCTADGYGSDAMYVNANNGSSITGGTFYGSIEDPGNKIHGLTVTYHLNNDKNYATQVLQPGDQITLPDPAKPGCTFDGWYKDGTKWDSATPVNENLTLIGWLYKGVKTADEFTAALADSNTEVIRLEKDITLDGNTGIDITNGRKVILDLGGYVLDLAGKHISVSANSATNRVQNRLTVMDSRPTAEHKFKDDGTGLWVPDDSGDKLVKGGVITGGKDTYGGGAIEVGWYGTVIMNGGNIVGCAAGYYGGAVNIINGTTFEMNGGSIMGCKAGYAGGAVCVGIESNPFGTFTMTGGSIADCTAVNGSGVYLYDKMNAGGGTVGGTVVLESNSTIQGGGTTFSGLIINNNPQARFGGAHSPMGIVGEEPLGANGYSYHKVTFALNGGTMEYPERYFCENGHISDKIKPNDRAGYTFGGWYKADGTAWDYANHTVTEEITLYAKWNANTYTVTFEPNGGDRVTPETMTVTYGKELNQMPIPVYRGYIFIGWFDQKWGGRQYSDGNGNSANPYDKTENCTLYAMWQEAPLYTVTFDPNGGTLTGPATRDRRQGDPVDKPDDPVREGYDFDFTWYKDAACTQKWDFSDPVMGNMTLYAGWTIRMYTITVKPENGDADITIFENYGTAITAPTLTKTGYTFAGWDKEFPTTMPAGDLTITAKWTVNSYTITVKPENGDADITITRDYGTAVTAPTLTKTGYTFAGWDKEFPTTMPAENLTVTAKWTVNAYTITVKPENGDADFTITQDYGTAVTAPTLTKTGYTFAGWDKEFPTTMPAENLTVMAKWTINSYTVTFDTDGGSPVAPITQNYGTVITKPADPKKTGYLFGGWDTAIPETMPAQNLTIKAKWTLCDHKGNTNALSCTKETVCSVCEGKVPAQGHVELPGYRHDERTHWIECKNCTEKLHQTAHSGGTATCWRKAKCEYCGEFYGTIDKNNHTDLHYVPYRRATEKEEGHFDHWYCGDCDRYFLNSAATVEVPGWMLVIDRLKSGDDQKGNIPTGGESATPWAVLALLCGAAAIAHKKIGRQ